MPNLNERLSAALQRQIATHRGDVARLVGTVELGADEVRALLQEMHTSDSDQRLTTLAKAVAREVLRVKPEQSARAINYARALASGRMVGQAPSHPAQRRVLAAEPHGAAIEPDDEEQRRRSLLAGGLAAVRAAVRGSR